jgi:2-polyprenyl-6-methoxyphenol hydroxylase-like FAD-dependent oxidoreductase
MMLGLLLARAGVPVTVMEKHPDFLRDFRGDTVHASTLRLLDELGLADTFAALPHRMVETVTFRVRDNPLTVDLRTLPGPHQHIALVPQWDFLEMLAKAAEAEPAFTLMRSTEVLGPLYDGNRIVGVRYRRTTADPDGAEEAMRADLTVACDGRASTLRQAAALRTRSFGAPMDVWWFRLPRTDADPAGLNGVFNAGRGMALIDRGDYFQIAYLIRKGGDAAMRAEGIEAFQHQVTALVPWLADRIDTLTSFDDVKLLDVQLNRLRRWYRDGLLLIGDAAHAMSPVGGVGINLAVADAVAAGRILAAPLRDHRLSGRDLAKVQARRWAPTALIQGVQRLIQNRFLAPAIADTSPRTGPPVALRIATRFPVIRRIAAYGVAIGPLPEHAPPYARR